MAQTWRLKLGKDVDGEKGGEEEEEGEVEKKEQEEEEVVDATGVTSMLLRVTAQTRGEKW